MKKYVLISIASMFGMLLISLGIFLLFFSSNYVTTHKYIIGYEIFDNKENDPTCAMLYSYELFITDEYVYMYDSHGCDTSEFVVKVNGEYITLSDIIENYNVSNDDIEKSGIGYRCYDCLDGE